MINARPCPTKVTCTPLVPNVAPVTAEEPAGFFSSEALDPFVPPPPPPPPPPTPCVGPGCFPPPNINGDTPTPYRPTTRDPPPNIPPPTINQDPNTPVFLNELQTCGAECPDGSTSSHTVAAGLYRGATQAQANEIALSICEKEAGIQALCFQTTSLPDVCKNSNYDQTIVATGGTPHVNFAYDWEIVGGSLPPGITLNPINGALTGIPTSSGAFTFTVQITDASGQTKTAVFSINVVEITSAATLPSGVVGTAYETLDGFTFTETPFSVGSWSVVSGSFPSGMVVDPSSGIVTGTPTTDGLYNFTIGFNTGEVQCTKACAIRIYKADTFKVTFSGAIGGGVVPIATRGPGLFELRWYFAGSAWTKGDVSGSCPGLNWIAIEGGPGTGCSSFPAISLNPIGAIEGYAVQGPDQTAADVQARTLIGQGNPTVPALSPVRILVAGRKTFEVFASTTFTATFPNYTAAMVSVCGCGPYNVGGGGVGPNFEFRQIGKL